MEKFVSDFGDVELTKERERHILQFHPEIKTYRRYFKKTIAQPDAIRHSVFDPKVIIPYRFLTRSKKYLAIVTKTNNRNFILTSYLTHKIKYKPL